MRVSAASSKPSARSRSSRLAWVRVLPAGTGSVVQVGGFSLQRKSQFEEEFARLVRALMQAAGGEVPPDKEAAIP